MSLRLKGKIIELRLHEMILEITKVTQKQILFKYISNSDGYFQYSRSKLEYHCQKDWFNTNLESNNITIYNSTEERKAKLL